MCEEEKEFSSRVTSGEAERADAFMDASLPARRPVTVKQRKSEYRISICSEECGIFWQGFGWNRLQVFSSKAFVLSHNTRMWSADVEDE